jgi:hypothetical protein
MTPIRVLTVILVFALAMSVACNNKKSSTARDASASRGPASVSEVEGVTPISKTLSIDPNARSCTYDGKEYSDGAVTCQNGIEYRCDDGSWTSLGTRCGNVVTAQGLSMDAALLKTSPLPCITFFAAGLGKLGIRNNCSECKTAVVSWTPRVGVRRYKVEAYKEIIVNQEDQTGQLIGEEPCR